MAPQVEASNSRDSLLTKKVTRRRMLKVTGYSAAAISFASIPAFLSVDAKQEIDSKAQILPANHFLAKAAIKDSNSFPMGSDILKLDLSLKSGVAGQVYEFTHSDAEAEKLGRKTSVIEGVVIPIMPESASMKAIQKYLAQNKVPKTFSQSSSFIAFTTRRRKTNAFDRLNLFKEFPTDEKVTMIYGFSVDDKKQITVCMIPPSFVRKRLGKRLRPGNYFKFIPVRIVAPAPVAPAPVAPAPVAPPNQTADEKDFMECFTKVLPTLQAGGTALAVPFCHACIVAIAATTATAGLTAPAVLGACGGCLFFFLAPISIAFVACAGEL